LLPNTLKFYRYHGPKRENDPEKFGDINIVFTTYATAAADIWRGDGFMYLVNGIELFWTKVC
jgi:hypothetical protein